MRVTGFLTRVVYPAVGGAFGILVMTAFGQVAHLPLMMVPFTTSIVLVMATPLSLFARPRNILGGHVLSAVAGFAVLWTLGSNPWMSAIAVGLAIALMQISDTLHPPAGINAFIIVMQAPDWSFFFVPVTAGAVMLVGVTWLFHKVTQPGVYPIRKKRE